ncbi:nuclear transcription factor Y subunit C-2-like [Apium graveolens]|uniref:nuclear transcription factor Y subunit C-2-like n=1 Tax=Apium graveolens TaxID=4045 RepID=UPI003D78D1C2
MSSTNPKKQPKQVNDVNKLSSRDQLVQPNPNDIAHQRKIILARFWNYQRQQMAKKKHIVIKKHVFPLSRIKKIMRADPDVELVANETPVLLAKAAELFIQELTIKSWLEAEHAGRRTLRKDDILEVVNETNYYDFLFDLRDKPAGGGSSSMVSGNADPVASSSVPTVTVKNGALMLTPAVQRWIRYDDENVKNEGKKNDDDGTAAK